MARFTSEALTFADGVVESIAVDVEQIDVTTMGDTFRRTMPGRQTVRLALRLFDAAAIDRVLAALGATPRQARAVAEAYLLDRGAPRAIDLTEPDR